MLRCDCSDAYILVKGIITVNGVVNGVENEAVRRNKPLILKNIHHVFHV